MNAAAVLPGQAILISRMMDVFTLTGEAMTQRGDFFATMFIVMAAGCLVFYFCMGWSVNVIAQVRGFITPQTLSLFVSLDWFVDPIPLDSITQAAKTDVRRHAATRSPVLRPTGEQHRGLDQPCRLESAIRLRADGLQHCSHTHRRVKRRRLQHSWDRA